MSAPLPKPRRLIECACGEVIEIWDVSDHLCICGREYDANGKLLSPRRFWGNEKGGTSCATPDSPSSNL